MTTPAAAPSIEAPDGSPPASDERKHAASRVVKGLVDDRYRIAARTADLSADDALQLATLAEIGNEQEPIPDAVAYLDVPGTGRVVARYRFATVGSHLRSSHERPR